MVDVVVVVGIVVVVDIVVAVDVTVVGVVDGVDGRESRAMLHRYGCRPLNPLMLVPLQGKSFH